MKDLIHKPWVPPVMGGALGLVVGASAATAYHIWKQKRDTAAVEEELEALKREREKVDADRIAADREFQEAIGKATAVTNELRDLGMNVVSNLEGLRIKDVVGGGDSLQVEVERVVQPPNPDAFAVNYENPNEGDDTDDRSVQNIFGDGDDSWNYDDERATRSKDRPYIIHVDEFVADEFDYESQSTLTWYEKDQILTDSKDVPVYNHAAVVGELRFGHGSNDPNVVYIRNERLKAEYEVLRDPGSYQETVLGESFDDQHLRHDNGPRRMRDYD